MKLTEICLEGDGDFRSPECVKLLDEADVVVTNPPFSLFREYVAQLVEHGKKFLVLGNMNALKYKEIFPLIKDGKVWPGLTWVKEFKTDDGEMQKFGNIVWYTNLDHEKRHEELVCVEKYSPEKYPVYANYPNAVEVGKIANIPVDYDGEMGVTVSYLMKHNPDQFEIVGELNNGSDNEWDYAKPRIDGKVKYTRILIKRKPSGENKADRGA